MTPALETAAGRALAHSNARLHFTERPVLPIFLSGM
jgi:hypothetical protein